MIETIFEQLEESFQSNRIDKSLSYYFSIEDVKKTVYLEPDSCRVEDGKSTDSADCVCKTTADFFNKIWNENYRPGLQDFLSGAIRSNNPEALKTFLTAFGKDA